MRVACHPDDLRAASTSGLRTGYVGRPLERGPDRTPREGRDDAFDLVASDFIDLDAQFANG